MRSTRRELLGFAGASLAAVSGCLSLGPAAGNGTPTSEDAIEVRLHGPDVDRVLFERTAVRAVGAVQTHDGRAVLDVTLSDEGTDSVSDAFHSADVDDDPGAFEVIVLDRQGEVTRFGVSPSLANEIAGGDWDGAFRLTFERRSTAGTVREALACGTGTASPACTAE